MSKSQPSEAQPTAPAAQPAQVIAIDGPAGAGKSSVARELAHRLGMAFLDTGAMYRAATWWAMRQSADLDNAEALVGITERMPLDMDYHAGQLRVRVDGEDVTQAIRSPEVTRNIRFLDGIPGVRNHLVRLQREFAAKQPTVAEGRDMGTVVFPNARCKIYLDASIEERTRRRAEQLIAQGEDVDAAALEAEIEARDENDRKRRVAPLRRADDAILVDTTDRTFEQVVDEVERIAKERL